MIRLAEYQKKNIVEMKPGDRVESVFSIHYKKPVCAYRFGTMFEFRVADKTGQITVKYWGNQEPSEVEKVHDSLARDAVVRIKGTVGEFKGQMELAVNPKEGGEVRVLSEGEYEITDLIGARDDIPQLVKRLKALIESVENPYLSALLEKTFGDDEYMSEFSKCPASIMLHSNEVGGLIYHTLNVAEHCLLAWEQFRQMDRDLLLTGALLHDVGKVDAFRVTTNINQTEEGIFLGHLILGMSFIQSKIDEIDNFPKDTRNKILHILLSHHGKREWGSPVEPSIPEALAVHFADDFDAKLEYMLIKRETATTDDSWTWDSRFRRHIYLK